jgi:hypothetical protein
MRNFYWVGLWFAWLLSGCFSPKQVAPTRVARTSGSAVALSRDERIAVVTNRSAGIVSVFSLAAENAKITAKLVRNFDTGADSEPWAAVIGVDDEVAYVLFRKSQTVHRITNLHGMPTLQDEAVVVGSEPSAIAITPSGRKLFVANWGEGTLSVITTDPFVDQVKLDLNQALVDTGALGGVTSRLALAHPHALAVTDDGDDDDLDETLYATEFFSQPLPGVPPAADFSDVDRNRQGLVYPVSIRTGHVGPAISIAPVFATGFFDGDGRNTSCFPNQLAAAAANGGRLYVTSMCTSPRGPLGPKTRDGTATDKNFKTLFHPAVFVIDTSTNQELQKQGQLLTQVLDGYFQAGEDTADERMPLTPSDIAFADTGANGSQAYLSASGADALFQLNYDAAGSLNIGAPGARYIDVQANHGLPIGTAVSKTSVPAFALAVSDTKTRLSIIDRATQKVTSYADASADASLPRAAIFRSSEANQGHSFFGTGTDIWSYKGQAWSSCESCHPGGLSDGVTWFFARGPRRTISTAGTYDKNPDVSARMRRLLLWGANIDEVHDVEAIVRNVSGGVGAVLWGYAGDGASNDCRLLYDGSAQTASNQPPCLGSKPSTSLNNGLNGAMSSLEAGTACTPDASTCDVIPGDWHMIDSFIRSQRAPRAPTDLLDVDVATGRTLFREARCAGCHGGPGWTISKLFYQPGAAQNGALPYAQSSAPLQALGALRTSTYSVQKQLINLNPAALAGGGSSPFRTQPPAGTADTDVNAFFYKTANAQDDQILCALRDVGTYPQNILAPTNVAGVVPSGAPGVSEVRQDMTSQAQGALGFNVPSLFGLALGAPYFHAGNARTLEEVFDSATFARHYQALAAPDFLADPAKRPEQIRQLVAFLLSIDESSLSEMATGTADDGSPLEYDFCQPQLQP